MNPQSLQKTLPGKILAGKAYLVGYRRKLNAYIPEANCLALNIIPENGSVVTGVLISVSDDNLEDLKKREIGYACIDVTSNIHEKIDGRVFTFVILDSGDHPGVKIFQSYLNTCLGGVPTDERDQWMKDTIITSEIEDDTANPKYGNAVPLNDEGLT